ncbi:MAG: hypothetical protein HY321_22765 [Armatimonadetes bacterium]|nr:hypothetical protein [Armatimonadota bacterium]
MQPTYMNDAKRRIAMQLVASGQWKARDWAALAAVVRSGILGLDETGRVVAAPGAEDPVIDVRPDRRRMRVRAARKPASLAQHSTQ